MSIKCGHRILRCSWLRQCLGLLVSAYLFVISVLFILVPQAFGADKCKVLVVMSYDDGYAWEQEIREGIETGLGEECELKWFYLDTKRDLESGGEKAKQAYELFLSYRPHGVIAADDNAQSMFVVPYLRNKTDIPVIFCGVNAEPGKYQYPAENVTGILEKMHIRQSIAFTQQLIPDIKKIGYLLKENPSGTAIKNQYEGESQTYPVESVGFAMPMTVEEALQSVKKLRELSDALFVANVAGFKDKTGNIYSEQKVIELLRDAYGKPIIANIMAHVEYGALCAVIKTGQEQGRTAVEMLRQAMSGIPVSEIPITYNKYGVKVINLKVMKMLGIKPASDILSGAKLVGVKN